MPPLKNTPTGTSDTVCAGTTFTPFGALDGVAVDPKGVVWVENGGEGEPGNYHHPSIDSFGDEEANVFLSSRVVKANLGAQQGLTVDSEDNLYVIGSGGVAKLSSTGANLGTFLDGIIPDVEEVTTRSLKFMEELARSKSAIIT